MMFDARPDGPSAQPRSVVLRTARLRLTTWTPGDLADLHALHADPRTMRYMRSGVEDEAASRARLDLYLGEQAELGWTKWRVEDAFGATVGRAGFKPAGDRRHRELGYLLAPDVWGQGLASELIPALLRWHEEHPEPDFDPQVYAFVEPENAASRRVLIKAGFEFVDERIEAGRTYAFYRTAAPDVSQ